MTREPWTVQEFQRRIVEHVRAWDEYRGSQAIEEITFAHLVEEVGELAAQYVNMSARKERYDEAEVENAIGDIICQVVKLADQRGLDIEKVVLRILEEDRPTRPNPQASS